MNAEQQKAADDLAFLRALAEGGRESQMATGAGLLAGGVLYALQCFVFGAQMYGWLHMSDAVQTAFAAGVTVVFLLAIAWITWRNRGSVESGGVVARALQAAFASAGMATLALVAAFGLVAVRERSLTIWLLFPCAVFALQGAAWMIAWMLRRRTWLAVVAFGWLLCAVALSWSIETPLYPFVAGAALVLFMAIPGAIIMRPSTS